MLPKGPGDEDLNAIENEYYTIKGKAKTRTFLPNKVLELYLGIGYVLRSEIEDYIEEYNNNPVPVCYHVFYLSQSKHLFFRKKSLQTILRPIVTIVMKMRKPFPICSRRVP